MTASKPKRKESRKIHFAVDVDSFDLINYNNNYIDWGNFWMSVDGEITKRKGME